MPDLSADRPLLLPEEIKGFTEEDVELVARAFDPNGELEPANLADARTALAALAAAGRLLPASAEHREEEEEFAVDGALPDGTPWVSDPHYRLGDARQLAAMMAPGAVIKRRMISAGPWTEVDGSGADHE